nr:hypothetical protein [Tanacetum cinerariifolium]
GEGSTVESHYTPTGAPSTSPLHLSAPPRSSIRQETEVPQPSSPTHTNVADEAASTGVDVKHRGATTTVTSLDAGHSSGNIDKIPSMPYNPPLPRVNTLGCDEGRMQHNELMDLVTKLLDRVLALETDLKQTKKGYGAAYTKLIMKDPSKPGRRIKEIDQDPDISLIQHDAHIQRRYDQDMVYNFDFDAEKEVSTAEKEDSTAKLVSTTGAVVTTASVDISPASSTRRVSTADDITMAKTLVYIRRSATKIKDKGKGIIEESESAMTKTKRQQEQERLGHEAAVRLQENFNEEERQRIARVHEAAQSFTKEEWENIRARVEADEELTQRLQAEERNKYSKVDQAKMLVDLINQRNKYFAVKRAEERRNKPMTQAQQRTYMSNYIKHMESHTLQQLIGLSFDEIKELFETTMKRVNTFVPIKTERTSELAAESSKKGAKEELDQGSSKKQKTNEASGSEQPDKEEKELSQEDLQQMMMIVLVEEVYVEVLQVKYPIIDWEVYIKESRKYGRSSGLVIIQKHINSLKIC